MIGDNDGVRSEALKASLHSVHLWTRVLAGVNVHVQGFLEIFVDAGRRGHTISCLKMIPDVTAPRGHVADKCSSWFLMTLGNCGKVPQVLGTSRSDCVLRLSFHNSEIGAEVREERNLD